MNNRLEIKLSERGVERAGRVVGIQLKDAILAEFKSGSFEKIILDFTDVTFVTSGFAKELFGGLLGGLGDDFKTTVGIRVTEGDVAMKNNIIRAINTALTTNN